MALPLVSSTQILYQISVIELDKRNLFMSKIMPSLAREGFTATGALEYMRSIGTGIRMTTWYKGWRTFGRPIQFEEKVKALGNREVIPDRFIAETEKFQPYTYRVPVQYTYVDPYTLEEKQDYVSVWSDYKQLPEYYLTEAFEAIMANYPDRSKRFIGMSILPPTKRVTSLA